MTLTRSHTLLALLLVLVLSNGSLAQAPPRAPRNSASPRQPCSWLEPSTLFEAFNSRIGTVIVTGTTRVLSLSLRPGSVDVDAAELRDESNGSHAYGVVLELQGPQPASGSQTDQVRAYIDYDEIDALIAAWDRVAKADETITKLTNFKMHYRTRDDFEIQVFRQTPGGAIAGAISGGRCERVRLLVSLEELSKVRWSIAQAKAKLDEVK